MLNPPGSLCVPEELRSRKPMRASISYTRDSISHSHIATEASNRKNLLAREAFAQSRILVFRLAVGPGTRGEWRTLGKSVGEQQY